MTVAVGLSFFAVGALSLMLVFIRLRRLEPLDFRLERLDAIKRRIEKRLDGTTKGVLLFIWDTVLTYAEMKKGSVLGKLDFWITIGLASLVIPGWRDLVFGFLVDVGRKYFQV